MKYYERKRGTLNVKEYEITKENVVKTLASIKRAYLPDWNYATKRTGDCKTLPDDHYPMHLVINMAISAISRMDESFFEEMKDRDAERQTSIERHIPMGMKPC